MPDVKHYQIPEGQKNAGMWTFSVDGQESKYYCPTEHAAKRVVRRLEDGQTHSLGAQMTQALADARQVESLLAIGAVNPVTGQSFTKDELAQVVREKNQRVKVGKAAEMLVTAQAADAPPVKGWCYALDGEVCSTVHKHEAQAKSAGAFAAFMSRGKLGK